MHDIQIRHERNSRQERGLADDRKSFKVEVFGGTFWLVGWLFTVGFVDLTFWRGVLALILWPYFLGDALR